MIYSLTYISFFTANAIIAFNGVSMASTVEVDENCQAMQGSCDFVQPCARKYYVFLIREYKDSYIICNPSLTRSGMELKM